MKKGSIIFICSILFGILGWVIIFITTPVNPVIDLSLKTIIFVVLNYLALIIGFFFMANKMVFKSKTLIVLSKTNINYLSLFKILSILVFLSFLFRYMDLIINRGLSWGFSTSDNKSLAANQESFSVNYGVLSLFRFLYFVPILFYSKIKKKWIFIIGALLFLLPIPEAILRGSRRIVFESIGLLSLIVVLGNESKIKYYKKSILVFILVFFLVLVSGTIFNNREKSKPADFYSEIFNAQYNDFVPPTSKAVDKIQSEKNQLIKDIYFYKLHIGQYIIHGLYEMNYMISVVENHFYGMYTGYSMVKAFNKLGITDYSLKELKAPTERITYITFFGGLYLDFGYFSILIMFLYGIFQSIVFKLSVNNILFKPVQLLLVFSNSFLLVFNFIRASFLFTIIFYLFCLSILYFIVSIIRNRRIFFISKG